MGYSDGLRKTAEAHGKMCGGEARGLRQPAAAVAEGSLLPAARSGITVRMLRAARSRLRPPHSGSRLPRSTAPPRYLSAMAPVTFQETP